VRFRAESLQPLCFPSKRLQTGVSPAAGSAGHKSGVIQNPPTDLESRILPERIHFSGFAQGDNPLRDLFVLFRLSLSLDQTFRQEECPCALRAIPATEYLEQFFECAAPCIRFPRATRDGHRSTRFPSVLMPGHQFPEVLAGGVAVLADQHDSSMRKERAVRQPSLDAR